MDHRGFGLFVGLLFEALFSLLSLPFRLIAWALREDDPAAEVDAAAQAFRDATAAIDEGEPFAPRESMAQALRSYLRRERTLGDLQGYGPDVSAWALAARYENLAEDAVPRDDAAFEADVRAARLVSPASVADMRRALLRFADLPKPPTPSPTFDGATPAPAFAR